VADGGEDRPRGPVAPRTDGARGRIAPAAHSVAPSPGRDRGATLARFHAPRATNPGASAGDSGGQRTARGLAAELDPALRRLSHLFYLLDINPPRFLVCSARSRLSVLRSTP